MFVKDSNKDALPFTGYWNFTTENPDGCQQCTCNIHGTVQSADGGCDEDTGACTCKRNVAATRDCDQCKYQHYGLSESDPLGCKACDCDPGGAYNNNCDIETGQCQCRPNIKVRAKQHHDKQHHSCRVVAVTQWLTTITLDLLTTCCSRESLREELKSRQRP